MNEQRPNRQTDKQKGQTNAMRKQQRMLKKPNGAVNDQLNTLKSNLFPRETNVLLVVLRNRVHFIQAPSI